ncbi:phage tail protein [Salmonella enterica subsp. enterica]|uniref:Phage tail protein n=1 Tax=Salmonella enterica TaxID=28901 RepID=A0A3R0C605_SALER|nr:phage tail protein [Salmonella enterica]EDW1730127.1 phage tail protein [Salmonella enterica subsp. enterica]MIK90783.1 phage tail protein [Salmonella enterica]
MSSLKKALLSATPEAVPCHLLGIDAFIRRMSAMELIQYDEGISAAREKDDARATVMLSAGLILSAMVTDKGVPYAREDLPTEEEIAGKFDHGAIIDAVSKIQRCSYGTLEEAEKN